MNKSGTIMTEGSIFNKMIAFAVPIFIGNLFQQLYNTADAIIVGNMLGNGALAAVSATGNLIFLITSFFVGVSSGAGVLISRYYGAREEDKLSLAIHTNIAFSLATGVILTILGTTLTPVILRWMGTPDDVMDGAVAYTRIYFAGCMGLVMYNSLRSTLQALGDSRNPLIYLVVSSVINVILDIVIIALFKTGVEGAAIATVIAQFISVFMCTYRLMVRKDTRIVYLKEIKFNKLMLNLTIQYGLPAGMQNSVIAFANVVVQSAINSYGTMAIAGCGAYSKLEGFAFLPITSFTIALTTFVGQNLGAKEYERTRKGAKFGIICAVILSEVIGILFYIIAPILLRAFTSEPEAIYYGVLKARNVSLFFCLLAATHSFAAVLRGAGKAVIPMAAMLISWCVIRVCIIKIVEPIFNSIVVVNMVYPVTWFISTVILVICYIKSDWIHAFEREV